MWCSRTFTPIQSNVFDAGDIDSGWREDRWRVDDDELTEIARRLLDYPPHSSSFNKTAAAVTTVEREGMEICEWRYAANWGEDERPLMRPAKAACRFSTMALANRTVCWLAESVRDCCTGRREEAVSLDDTIHF